MISDAEAMVTRNVSEGIGARRSNWYCKRVRQLPCSFVDPSLIRFHGV